MELNYCRRCGEALAKQPNGVGTCPNGHASYPNPAPCVGLFLFDSDDNLLLSVRGQEPMKGMLDAFGGFVDGTESIEEALRREVKEELGLEPTDYTTPIYLTSASSSYDFQGESRTVLSSLFYAYLLPGAVPQPADDVAAIHTAKMDDISVDDIGNQDIRVGFIALANRLAGTS